MLMLLGFFIALLSADGRRVAATNFIVRNTSSGLVTGFSDHSAPNVAQFLGIPYAEPPVGDRRWLPPVAKVKPENINATIFGNNCPQFLPNTPTIMTEDTPEFNLPPGSRTGEDCLSLSIWAPKRYNDKNGSLPVLVWLYGGGFYTGGADIPYQNPAAWIENSQKHIVVAVNYRGNIFGFPGAAGLKPDERNLGFLDQRLAVEFIRSNIESFGGDPDRIVLWGQSSGAMSADFYSFAYQEDPIVAGLIMQSGTAHIPLGAPASDHSNFTYVANHFKCANLSAEAEVDCLRKVSAADIIGFMEDEYNIGAVPALAFSYVVDNRTVFANYTERALEQKFAKIPAIIGTTVKEGEAFAAYDKVNGPDKEIADYFTLGWFLCTAVQAAHDRYAVGSATYRYLYGGNFSNISPQWWEGAYHGSEIPLIFGTSGIARGASTPFQLDVSKQMQDYWVAFAEDPVNGLSRLGWNPYDPQGDSVLIGWENVVTQPVAQTKLEEACDGLNPRPGVSPPP